MTSHRRYRAVDAEPFGELVRLRDLAGFRLEPAAPREVWDVYADTPDRRLLRRGLVLRIRKHGDTLTGSLRAGEDGAEIASARWTQGGTLSSIPELPDGDLKLRVQDACAGAHLDCTLRFHQYRTPRAIFDGDRLVGVLSLDVVADQTDPAEHSVSSEVELELTGSGTSDDLTVLDNSLQEIGFLPDAYSKFQRGIIRLGADENRTLTLLPSERTSLEDAREHGSGVERRRAEAILFAADGVSEEEISQRVGLASARVRHWIESFRSQRMKAIDPTAPDPSVSVPDSVDAPVYRVSEVVEGGGASIRIEREEPPQELRRVMSVLQPPPQAMESQSGEPQQEFGDDESRGPGFSGDGEPSVDQAEPMPSRVGELDRPREAGVRHETTFRSLLSTNDIALGQARLTAAAHLIDCVLGELTALGSLADDDPATEPLDRALAAIHVAELVGDLVSEGVPGETTDALRQRAADFRRVVVAALGLARSRGRLDIDPQEPTTSPVAIALATTVWTVDLRRILQERTPALDELKDALRATASAIASAADRTDPQSFGAVLPELLWTRYRHLRTVANAGAIPADLPDLEMHTDAMMLVLSLFREVDVHQVAAALTRLRANLETVSAEADLALQLDAFISDWIVPGAAADPEPLRRRREAAEVAAVGAMAELEASLLEIQSSEFRRRLGEVTSAV